MPLFSPYRAIGYVTDALPFTTRRAGPETYVTVSVGRAWQIFNCSKLHLVFVGSELPKSIRALASLGDRTFAAFGSSIAVFERAHMIAELTGHTAKISLLLTFGSHLISVDQHGGVLVWAVGAHTHTHTTSNTHTPSHNRSNAHSAANTREAGHGGEGEGEGEGGATTAAAAAAVCQLVNRFQLPAGFVPTAILHPDTYLNKVLIASADGRMQLWNVNTAKLIHEFNPAISKKTLGAAAEAAASPASSPSPSPWGITCLAAAPALDTVALGCSDGRVRVHNIRRDISLFELTHSETEAVSAVAFRTDGQPMLAAGSQSGGITLWLLQSAQQQRLHSLLPDAHNGRVVSMHFLAGQPVLLSAAADNSLKMWLFDTEDSPPRLLRFRCGHAAPPTCLRYYGNGRHLLSAGFDRTFRVFSIVQDQRSREMSQGHIAKKAKRLHAKEEYLKLPPVICMDAAEVRERDWQNVVTCHEGHPHAYLWHLRSFAISKLQLVPPGSNPAPATVCATSACGNFALLGSSSGALHLFNLQSGRYRHSFRPRNRQLLAHRGAVTGVASDAFNRRVLSCSQDGLLKVWYFKTGRLRHLLRCQSPATHMKFLRHSNLAAVACDDNCIRVFDTVAARLVRRFRGHSDRITAIDFSSDGRLLLSASMDLSMRVWDVVTGNALNSWMVPTAAVGLSLSPSTDMLATIHVNRRGIYLWANRALFSGVSEADLCGSETATGGGGGSGEQQQAGRAAVVVSLPGLVGPQDETGGEGGVGAQGGGDGLDGVREAGRSTAVRGSDGEWGAVDGSALLPVEKWEAASSSLQIRDDAALPSSEKQQHQQQHEHVHAQDAVKLPQVAASMAPAVPGMVTLGMLPRSQWLSLSSIDVIKERNRPLEAPKKPEQAPFFLPSLPSLSGDVHFGSELTQGLGGGSGDGAEGVLGVGKSTEKKGKAKKREREQQLLPQSQLLTAVLKGSLSNDYSEALRILRAMSPSAIDLELQLMEVVDLEAQPEGERVLCLFLDFLVATLTANTEFELMQAVANRFLTVHALTLYSSKLLQEKLKRLQEVQAAGWKRVDELFQTLRCVVDFIRA